MRQARFTDSQILAFLQQNKDGAKVPDLCQEHGFTNAQFYKWCSKFGGMESTMIKRLIELEEENRRLKKMYVEAKLKADIRDSALKRI